MKNLMFVNLFFCFASLAVSYPIVKTIKKFPDNWTHEQGETAACQNAIDRVRDKCKEINEKYKSFRNLKQNPDYSKKTCKIKAKCLDFIVKKM